MERIRVSQAEVDFYIMNLKGKGYTLQSSERVPKGVRYVLRRGDEVKIVEFIKSGWCSIY